MLSAAYDILVERGLAEFTIESVAARSGVARTTIYRWWASKGLLAHESFLEAVRQQLRFPRTGCTADDLEELLQSLRSVLSGPAGRIAASVIAEAQSDQDTKTAFLEGFSNPLRKECLALVQAGVDSGEFRLDLNQVALLDAAIGALYFRMLLGQQLDPAWVTALVGTLIQGCMP